MRCFSFKTVQIVLINTLSLTPLLKCENVLFAFFLLFAIRVSAQLVEFVRRSRKLKIKKSLASLKGW